MKARAGRSVLAVVGVAIASGALGTGFVSSTAARAAMFGSNLVAPASGSVCAFQSLEPEIHICTVGPRTLLVDHTASDGLVAPFDGVVVRWSVTSGKALSGTGAVKLALRTMSGPGYLAKGPEVELPTGSPGSRYSFSERMSVSAGQPLGLKISIEKRNTQEAGAPIGFRGIGVGEITIGSGEPTESIWTSEEDVELLLNAEIEPDGDHDGYGDLTKDCPSNLALPRELCDHDFMPPMLHTSVVRRQDFLRTGVIHIGIGADEAGIASANGRLEIKGRGGWSYALCSAHKRISANGRVTLNLHVRKKALMAARANAANG